ncbi:MAG: response regulator transcription factor [Maritimibacter sp.]|uniref:response regulator transcription factor n=1 Tax=Maritimibacter sp. TaxID=2003363 RepID=UPI001D496041|nr:response regulator transcription factor [Maritimibacter sp.]MBL6427082.1 response regulator transcription factor [Maritimibacter sp.]
MDITSALIVDDHPLFCDALAMTLQAVGGIRSVTTAGSLTAAMAEVEGGASVDLIVLDLNLPDVDGLDGLIRLRKAAGVPVLVVSSMADNRMISAVTESGASGFVPKHSPRDVFRAAIDTIRADGQYLPDGYVTPQETEASGPRRGDDAATRIATLTNQQARILQLICEGKLNKQIAYDLSIAETTVKAHVTAIMRKLGVQSRTQAVLIAKETSFASVLQGAARPA